MSGMRPRRCVTGDPGEMTVEYLDACIEVADGRSIEDRARLHLCRAALLGIELTDAYLIEVFGISEREAASIFAHLHDEGFWEWR